MMQAAAPESTSTFEARDGERLSVALSRFLAPHGWDVEWSSSTDFLIERGYRVAQGTGATDLQAALLIVLRPYRLSAVMHDAPPQRVVNVVPAEPDPGRQP